MPFVKISNRSIGKTPTCFNPLHRTSEPIEEGGLHQWGANIEGRDQGRFSPPRRDGSHGIRPLSHPHLWV